MDTPLVINIDTGAIAFRTEENAEQCNCRPISHRHAAMVASGELPLLPLLAAIKKHMMSAEDFDYDAYTEARRKLNVRHGALHADERRGVEDADEADYVSDEEVEKEKAEAKAKADLMDKAVVDAKKRRPSRKAKQEPEAEKAADDVSAAFIH